MLKVCCTFRSPCFWITVVSYMFTFLTWQFDLWVLSVNNVNNVPLHAIAFRGMFLARWHSINFTVYHTWKLSTFYRITDTSRRCQRFDEHVLLFCNISIDNFWLFSRPACHNLVKIKRANERAYCILLRMWSVANLLSDTIGDRSIWKKKIMWLHNHQFVTFWRKDMVFHWWKI